MAQTSGELMLIKHPLEKLRFDVHLPMTMYHDNLAAIHIISKFQSNVPFEISVIATLYISKRAQVADMFTKLLCKVHLDLLCNKLGLYDTYTLA